MNGTVVHRPVTVDSGVPSSCQISSLLSVLENHIDLEMNLLLTATWIPFTLFLKPVLRFI